MSLERIQGEIGLERENSILCGKDEGTRGSWVTPVFLPSNKVVVMLSHKSMACW